MSAGDIAGRTILVTRAAEDAEYWASRLEQLGARPVVLPCLVCEPIADAATTDRLRAVVAEAEWLLLASRRGVEEAARLLDGALPPRVRLAVVGPATARAAQACFGRVDLVASRPTSRALASELADRLRRDAAAAPTRVVVVGAAGGRDDAEAILVACGVAVTRVNVYRTVPAPPVPDKRDLAADGVNDILLASPSAVEGLLNRAQLPRAARVITIGPTTSAAARAAGLAVAAEARRPDLEGMLEVIP